MSRGAGAAEQRLRAEDIAVLVFTSALNLRERALSVQETWLLDFPNGYLVGGFHEDPGLRMIALGPDVGEDYRSAHKKQFLGLLEMRRRFPEAKWFFVTGCDAYVYADNLLELLEGFDCRKEYLVGGHCGSVKVSGESLVFPAGGPGFAVSAALLDALLPAIPAFVDGWAAIRPDLAYACDIAFAYLASRERGVKVSFAEGFYACPPYRYPGNPYLDGDGRLVDTAVVANPIAYHMLSIREMYRLRRGRALTRPGLLARVTDAGFRYLARRLRTKSLVNRIARGFAGRD